MHDLSVPRRVLHLERKTSQLLLRTVTCDVDSLRYPTSPQYPFPPWFFHPSSCRPASTNLSSGLPRLALSTWWIRLRIPSPDFVKITRRAEGWPTLWLRLAISHVPSWWTVQMTIHRLGAQLSVCSTLTLTVEVLLVWMCQLEGRDAGDGCTLFFADGLSQFFLWSNLTIVHPSS